MHTCERFKKVPSEIMNLPPGERALLMMYTLISLQQKPQGRGKGNG
jgi:hypothetical protein